MVFPNTSQLPKTTVLKLLLLEREASAAGHTTLSAGTPSNLTPWPNKRKKLRAPGKSVPHNAVRAESTCTASRSVHLTSELWFREICQGNAALGRIGRPATRHWQTYAAQSETHNACLDTEI